MYVVHRLTCNGEGACQALNGTPTTHTTKLNEVNTHDYATMDKCFASICVNMNRSNLDKCFASILTLSRTNAFCIDPYHSYQDTKQHVCYSIPPQQHVCYSTHVNLKLTGEASELHLHHDVELEDEDLPNIAMNNVALDANGGVVEVRVEDRVAILPHMLPFCLPRHTLTSQFCYKWREDQPDLRASPTFPGNSRENWP